MSLSPEDSHPNAPVEPIDLWIALDRLSRSDRDMLAARWAAVRHSRLQRRALAALAASRTAS